MTDHCPITFDQLFRDHLEFGWQRLKQSFKTDRRIAKMRVLPPGNRATLSLRMVELLTSARTFLVEYLFQCYNRNRFTTYTAFGSTTIFSDYDITLLGENAPDVMWRMFTRFVAHYQNTLANAFDTNLYCTGYFSSRNSRNIPERLLLPGGMMALQPQTMIQERQCLLFAAMKLPPSLNVENESRRYPNLARLLTRARPFQARLDAELEWSKSSSKTYSPETQTIIQRYALYYKYAKRLYRMLYRGHREYSAEELFQLACVSNYYAIEAYYTPCTVNVVVLESQGKHKLALKPIEYLCAAIENLGDWNTHHLQYQQERNLPGGLIMLSLSKYLFRVYSALGQLPGKHATACRRQAIQIERRILVFKHETQPNYAEIPFSLIGYRVGQSTHACVRVHTHKVLGILETILARHVKKIIE